MTRPSSPTTPVPSSSLTAAKMSSSCPEQSKTRPTSPTTPVPGSSPTVLRALTLCAPPSCYETCPISFYKNRLGKQRTSAPQVYLFSCACLLPASCKAYHISCSTRCKFDWQISLSPLLHSASHLSSSRFSPVCGPALSSLACGTTDGSHSKMNIVPY